jgi:SAM-dependent methyltransferase
MSKDTLTSNIFENMFSEKLLKERMALWKVLCNEFFQRYISRGDTVLDLGAGFCEFINNIQCEKKIAVDLNDHTPRFAGPEVEVLTGSALHLAKLLKRDNIDVVFSSNFFEHMQDKNELKETLLEIKKVLKPGGKLLILQPNIRYAYKVYWDFYDHHIPLSHNSLQEIISHVGFETVELRPKFLPWTTKSRFPKHPFLIKLFLKLPLLQFILGKQMFYYARKGGS